MSMMQNPKQAIATSSLASKLSGQPAEASARPHDILCEGWLLKRRRKKLQGHARRYFVLRSSGLLYYSFQPHSDIRDQIFVPSAAISSTQHRKDIHVDSGRVTFHIKCLCDQDFTLWMTALRKFTVSGIDRERTFGRRSLSRATSGQAGYIQSATILLDDIGRTIEDLSLALKISDKRRSTASLNKDSTSKGSEKEHKEGHSLLSMFKRSSHSPQRLIPPKDDSKQEYDHLVSVYARLREQHASLSDVLMKASSMLPRSPVHETIDEESATPTARSPVMWHSMPQTNRSSISSVFSSSGSGTVWFDANEGEELGAEEFVLDDPDAGDEETMVSESRMTTTSSIERSEESEVEGELSYDGDDTRSSSSTVNLSVDRRTRLPARPNGDEGSLFAILKKNVGQDLSNISFPVTFNEPLTLLQRHAEELEYHELLNKAAAASDWVERLCYVAAFGVSAYASTKFRSGRKGFTPLVGETFEDTRMNFIAEKVVHKPLLIAYHAHGPGWELNATSSGKTKFWGKSFEIIPTGSSKVKIGDDEFQWNKPSSFTRNLMMGTKYLEHCGEMVINNTETGARCVIDFKETGYWASSPNVVAGTVYDPDGRVVTKLEGKWDEQVAQKLDPTHLRVLWRISNFPRDASEYYGFTYFGITLNEITPDLEDKLPVTDSRLRPDVRAFEDGNNALAEEEKARVEQMQRDRRQSGVEPQPRWFKQVPGSDNWIYTGGYWEARRSGWKNAGVTSLW